VLVRAVARVNHRRGKVPRDKVGCARGTMSYYDTIRLHRVSVRTVSSSDSPFFRLDDSACRFIWSAPSRDAAVAKLMRVASRRLEKSQRNGFPAQRGEFFQRMALNFLERFRLIGRNTISSAVSGSMPSMWPKRCDKPSSEF